MSESQKIGIDHNGLRIGPGHPVFIIAEAGINHEGDLGVAIELVDAAAETGADAVKFQTFVTELVITRRTPKANYHIETTGDDSVESWFELIKREELPLEDFAEIKQHCDDKGIIFLSTPYDMPSVNTLAAIGAPAMKVASTDTNNLPLLRHMARTGRPIILSTGMTDMDELTQSIKCLREAGCTDLVVMQCTAEYPAPLDDINLRAMNTISESFGVATGYSDHTEGEAAAIAAVALGACIYEKHFTLDKMAAGPDHRASMEPDELKALITRMRDTERLLGDGQKRIMPCEVKNKPILQKRIVAAHDLPAGTVLMEGDLLTKRTGGAGLSPLAFDATVGRTLTTAVIADEPLEESVLA
jgi:N-acetylneuraminate synthase